MKKYTDSKALTLEAIVKVSPPKTSVKTTPQFLRLHSYFLENIKEILTATNRIKNFIQPWPRPSPGIYQRS